MVATLCGEGRVETRARAAPEELKVSFSSSVQCETSQVYVIIPVDLTLQSLEYVDSAPSLGK